MKRFTLMNTALALVLVCALNSSASAETHTYFGFQIGVGSAPPPPRVVYVNRPRMVYEPETRVYIVSDGYDGYDAFRYGPYYYMCDDEYWYRARSYRGPFAVIDVRSVPEPIFRVPEHRWRHYPQGLGSWYATQAGPRGRGEAREHGHDRGNGYGRGNGGGRGHGNGNGQGHGHGDGEGR